MRAGVDYVLENGNIKGLIKICFFYQGAHFLYLLYVCNKLSALIKASSNETNKVEQTEQIVSTLRAPTSQ